MNIKRKPRSITDLPNLKAYEFRNFLFFYLRFALRGLIRQKLIENFELLSAAIYLLCKSHITHEEVATADRMLNSFADGFEEIYGKEAVPMNIHKLRHYAATVLKCSPLWSTSLFGFESNIGRIKNFVTGKTCVIYNIADRYISFKSLQMDSESKICNRTIQLFQRMYIKLTPEAEIVLNSFVQNNAERFPIYRRMRKGNTTYTSMFSLETKTMDYFVETIKATIGKVVFYFMFDEENYMLLETYDRKMVTHHLSVVDSMNCFVLFKCDQIKRKILHLEVEKTEFISQEPNLFE